MKKAMLFIVSMLFAVSASAAFMDVENGATGTNSTFLYAIDDSTPSSASAGFRAPSAGAFSETVDLVVDTTADYRVEWGFNPESSIASPFFSTASFNLVDGNYVAVLTLTQGVVYSFLAEAITNTGGMLTTFTVSAVPVPAALFLFAPALLGFLGLRRKATVVAA